MTKSNPLSRAAATAAAVLGACLLACVQPSAAAAKSSHSTGENTPLNLSGGSSIGHSSSSGGSIVRTIVGLAIVIAVIWGLSWILRQVKAGKDPHVASTGLTSVAALTLATGRSVHLVRAGNEYVLLGSAEHGVVPIHRYTTDEAREAGLLDVVEATPVRPRRALLKPPAGGEGPGRDGTGRGGSGRGGSPRAPARDQGSGGGHGPAGGHDPMRMPEGVGPGIGLIDRLRELTVRR